MISLHGEITEITTKSIARRIEEAKAARASVIVFDLNTPGGYVDATIEINDKIRSLTDVKTVAWVNPSAYSGGTAVALACNEIVMNRSSRIGDAQVIFGGPEGATGIPEELQPKVHTPVLDEFFQSARKNNYSEVLVEAFIIPEREVWWLENTETGEREFVFREDKERRVDQSMFKEEVSGESLWRPVETYFDIELNREVKLHQPVVRQDLLLQMSAGQAHAFGFSKGMVTSEEDLRAQYGLAQLIKLQPNWAEGLAFWMTSMYVRGFLLIMVFLGVYVEFHTPGVGLAGLVALICLALFVTGPYMTGLANIWEILLIVLGLILLGVELFVLPGFGIAGISGILLVVIGLLATFVPEGPGRPTLPSLPPAGDIWNGVQTGLVTIGSSLALSVVGMVLMRKMMPQMPGFTKLVPANPTPSQVQVGDEYYGVARVGDLGVAEGPLRPAGKARFGKTIVDVVTAGEFLERGERLQVIEHRGNRIVVRKNED